MSEQTYNVITHENKLKGLEKSELYPKVKEWKPKYQKNTLADYNILSNMLMTEHHFESPDKRPTDTVTVILF